MVQSMLGGALLSGCVSRAGARNTRAGDFEIIDFHAHASPPSIAVAPPPGANVPAELRKIVAKMANPDRVIQALDNQGVDYRILSLPLEAIPPHMSESRVDRMRRINDAIAGLCALDDRLFGMASIDAYTGDEGARELVRAVETLGLVGCYVECASDQKLISDPVALPTLITAASMRLPVFVHPVQEPALNDKFGLSSFYQMNLGRAAIASTTLAAILESGTFDDIPDLRICVSSLSISAMALGGLFAQTRDDAKSLLRKHVYADTFGLNAPMLSVTRDILGIERLMLGTDWPIFSGYSVRERLIYASAVAEFSDEDRNLIAAGNARRLFADRLSI
jgi:aminocarboxymuconate-semialdehyde decarboxylase